MFQSIAYNSKIEHDGHAYKSGEMISMDVAAKIILHQIVERGWNSQLRLCRARFALDDVKRNKRNRYLQVV